MNMLMPLLVSLLALLPASAAALTVSSVEVHVGSSVWCDTGSVTGACATATHLWNLGGGVTLTPGQTLIVTQTGPAFNFDTSETCPAPAGCAAPRVTINGLTFVDTQFVLAGIVAPGIFDPVNVNFNEGHDWVPLGTADGMTVSAGYADDQHLLACRVVTCVPDPFALGATVFLGGPSDQSPIDARCGRICFDAGAVMIRATAIPAPAALFLLGSGWLALVVLRAIRTR